MAWTIPSSNVLGGACPRSRGAAAGGFVCVCKPAGVPCVDADGGHSNVVSVMARCGGAGGAKLHLIARPARGRAGAPSGRMPRPGVLILARGGKKVRMAMEELAARRARKAACEAPLRWDSRANAAAAGGDGAKPARTYAALPDAADAGGGPGGGAGGRESVVLCLPRSGLRHQIRAHLRELGHPIANDADYGGRTDDGAGTRRGMVAAHRGQGCGE
eukprot:gene2002-556_t